MDSRARSLHSHAAAFESNDPFDSCFMWPHTSRDFEDDPDLLYRYDDLMLEVRHRNWCEHQVVGQLCSTELSEMLGTCVTIWSVASCTHQHTPILAVVARTEKHDYYVFWYSVLEKKTTRVQFDTPMQGPFSRMAMSRLPFTVVEESLDEIEQESNLRHLLVLGSDSGSIWAAMLEVDKSRDSVYAKTTSADLPEKLSGAITAIDILTQDRHERRLGYIDPRIALGSDQGHVQLLRLRARLSDAIEVIPAQDLNDYVRYPGTPITYLSCTRIPEQRNILLALGQDGTSKEKSHCNAYINVIELYGNWKRKCVGPLSPSQPSKLLTARATPCKHHPEASREAAKYQVVAVFQPRCEDQAVELAAWSIHQHRVERTDTLSLSKENLQEVIQDIWPLRDAMGYLLLYPQKLLELTISESMLKEQPETDNDEVAKETSLETSSPKMTVNLNFAADDAVPFEDAPRSTKRKLDIVMDPEEQANDDQDISCPISPSLPDTPVILDSMTPSLDDQDGIVDNDVQAPPQEDPVEAPSPPRPAKDASIPIAAERNGIIEASVAHEESPEDRFKDLARNDIGKAFYHQRQVGDDDSLSRDTCLTILLDTQLTEKACVDDLDELTALPFDNYEYLFLARYCWQCPRPMAKLFMMHCSIHRGKLAEAILLNDMIQASAELPTNLKAMCGTLAALARDTVRPVLNHLPLDIFSQPQGRPFNPFLKQTSSKDNFFRNHGLDAGATLLCHVLRTEVTLQK